jgi:hypothetical protein
MPTNGKRVAYGRNQVRVAIATYPDDTSVPVRTSHWNQDPHDQAILGFTKVTATLDASGIIYTKDDSSTYLEDNGSTYSRQSTLIEVECTGSTTTDVIAKIDVTDTLENDILYLFKGTAGDTITIASATPSVAGHIKTQLSGGATLVHDGVPIMLIRRGDYWYEFGADGAASTPYAAPTIGSTSIASGSTNATIAGLTLTTPNIGTPSAGTLTSCTGLPIATGLAVGSSANLAGRINDETGTGSLVFATSPTLVTPVLGTPASGALTNCTALPAAQVTAGTMASGHIIPDSTLTFSINAQTGTSYTTVLADTGKIITLNNGSAIAVTIPPNSGVAYPIGSSLTFISIGAGLTTIGQGSGVTIASVGGTATAPIITAQHNSATAIKIATNTWQVIGALT